MNYNQVENALNYTGKALYNGNISETYWRTGSDDIKRKYGYKYDALNRLTEAIYQKPNETVPVTNSYNESLSYDKNGNIISLVRNGEFDDANYALEIDNLTYTYHPDKRNQLMNLADGSNNPNGFKDDTNPDNDYDYDANGNMIQDNNKGIREIIYNHLNLPTKITFVNQFRIEYLYNATGQKIKKMVYPQTGSVVKTEYLDGFQYNKANDTTAVVLDFFPHAEGYVKVSGESTDYDYSYVYNYLDHLGNVRLSYGTEPNGDVVKILEENNYYPFGMKHNNYNVDKLQYEKYGSELSIEYCTNCSYKYKYNGKEFQDELGLNLYDYDARNYDPALGRWMNIDPLAEKGRRWSPYNYAMNNPMYFLDPDGMLSQSFMDKIWASASGTKWVNNDDGTFSDNTGNLIDENGKDIEGKGGADANRRKKGSNENDADSETDSFNSSKNESNSNESAAAYPDPKAFKFKTKGAWQEAAVVGLYFNVSLTRSTPKGIRFEYDFTLTIPQAILFTVPTNLSVGDTNISNEIAASETARIIDNVIRETVKVFAGTGSSPLQVEQYFRTALKREYQLSLPGARVNFNSMNYSVKPTLFRHK